MATFFTDFSEYTPDAQPSDWTERWDTDGGAANVRDSGIPGTPSTGGSHALEVTKTSLNQYALSWDEVGTPSGDVQLLILAYYEYVSGNDYGFESFLHGGGAEGSEDVYYQEQYFPTTAETRLLDIVNGSAALLGSSDEGLTSNQWIWVRLDRSSDTIRLRAWADGSSEPGTWAVSTTDSDLSSGWVGLGMRGDNGTCWFAQIGVGTGGDEAPSAPATSVITRLTTLGVG